MLTAFFSGIFGKALAIGALLLALGGVAYFLVDSLESAGEAKVEAANAQAALKQQQADNALSAKIIGEQQQKLDALQQLSDASLQQVKNEPVTSGCGPALRDAAAGVRKLLGLDGGGAAIAGPQPASTVPGPGAGGQAQH